MPSSPSRRSCFARYLREDALQGRLPLLEEIAEVALLHAERRVEFAGHRIPVISRLGLMLARAEEELEELALPLQPGGRPVVQGYRGIAAITMIVVDDAVLAEHDSAEFVSYDVLCDIIHGNVAPVPSRMLFGPVVIPAQYVGVGQRPYI